MKAGLLAVGMFLMLVGFVGLAYYLDHLRFIRCVP